MNKKLFLWILISALVLRVIFAFIVPPFEKPDEEAHFEYVKFLEENKKLPVQNEHDFNAEFFQPPFYHILAAILLKGFNFFNESQYYEVIFLRFLSIISSMLTLYFVYKISSILFKDEHIKLGILIFASFLPSHININSTITNANFGDFLTTSIIYMLIGIIQKGESTKNILMLGISAGIALLTRISLVPILAAIPMALIIKYYPSLKDSINIKKIIKSLIIIGLIALAISGWHLLRNFNLYGDFLGINAMKLASPEDNIVVDGAFISRLLGWTFVTFWAAFGRTNGVFIGDLNSNNGIILFALFYLFLLMLSVFAMYGLYKFLKSHKKGILNPNQRKAFLMLVAHLMILAFLFISFNLYDFQPQGRLFFPAISTLAIAFTLGLFNNFSNNNWGRILIYYLASFILMDIASIVSVLGYYSGF